MRLIRPVALVVLASCGGAPPEAGSAGDASAGPSVRFAIEVAPGVTGPVFVSLSDASAQPGWVRVSGSDGRVYLRERCEIPECGEDPAVCGMALPTVLDLARTESRSIELVWDGVTSDVDPELRCETRVRVVPGPLTATLCTSDRAELDGATDAATPTPGRLVEPECADVSFTLEDRNVVLRI